MSIQIQFTFDKKNMLQFWLLNNICIALNVIAKFSMDEDQLYENNKYYVTTCTCACRQALLRR